MTNEENQRKLFKSNLKFVFCDFGCQVRKSSIKHAKVLVFVSINNWNMFDEGAKIAIHSILYSVSLLLMAIQCENLPEILTLIK